MELKITMLIFKMCSYHYYKLLNTLYYVSKVPVPFLLPFRCIISCLFLFFQQFIWHWYCYCLFYIIPAKFYWLRIILVPHCCKCEVPVFYYRCLAASRRRRLRPTTRLLRRMKSRSWRANSCRSLPPTSRICSWFTGHPTTALPPQKGGYLGPYWGPGTEMGVWGREEGL